MVVYELGYTGAAVFVRQVELAAAVLLYVVVLRLWMVTGIRILGLYCNE